MAIESKNLLVWVKAMSRGQALPLDASEVYSSLAEAQAYAESSAIAYPGQTIKALLEDGTYHSYVLQPSDSGYTLAEIGTVSSSDIVQYVQVVEALPESGQIEGILYINSVDSTGNIWIDGAWKQIFADMSAEFIYLDGQIDALGSEIDEKAPIANPVFSGTVKVGEDEVALKTYVDSLFANLVSGVPKVVDSENPIGTTYKAGETYRVAEAGVYAGQECEVGDLIIVINDYIVDTASDADFIVLQSNIDGAVTSTADTSTVGEIVVFDAVTGKVIKGSGVQIASLNNAIAKAHEHVNKDILETYDKTQAELLDVAKNEAQTLVTAHETAVNEALVNKADKGTTLADYGITDAYNSTEIDSKLQIINNNLNTKASSTEVDNKIAERIGNIPEDTDVKTYVDNAIGSGGTDAAEAIAVAKQEAIDTSKSYTDEQIIAALAVTEF